MDGNEVAKRLRATPAGKEMLLMALTGYGVPEGTVTDFDAHLVKPVDMEELTAILERLSPPTRT
jgi:CheY-like chemotaxis protein